ncbi:hypothetical protein V5799_005362 [Amblyomma americanum]|uniref:Transmembrane protein n=1 Tax=Amblyomma americanum TaxID=6943 RepID=A0AAQ4DZG9_AMBAM
MDAAEPAAGAAVNVADQELGQGEGDQRKKEDEGQQKDEQQDSAAVEVQKAEVVPFQYQMFQFVGTMMISLSWTLAISGVSRCGQRRTSENDQRRLRSRLGLTFHPEERADMEVAEPAVGEPADVDPEHDLSEEEEWEEDEESEEDDGRQVDALNEMRGGQATKPLRYHIFQVIGTLVISISCTLAIFGVVLGSLKQNALLLVAYAVLVTPFILLPVLLPMPPCSGPDTPKKLVGIDDTIPQTN